jgi:hypothetical protein
MEDRPSQLYINTLATVQNALPCRDELPPVGRLFAALCVSGNRWINLNGFTLFGFICPGR